MPPRKYAIATVVISATFVATYWLTDKSRSSKQAAEKNQHSQTQLLLASTTHNSKLGGGETKNTLEGTQKFITTNPTKNMKAQALPALNLPLSEIFSELKEQSNGGSRAAACRLAYELSRCENYARNQKKYNSGMTWMASGKPLTPQQERVKAATEEAISKDAVICSSFTAGNKYKSSDYLLLAAQLGHPPSMVEYVVRGSAGLYERPPNTSELETYHANAPTLLAYALDLGIPEAYIFASSASVREFHGINLLPLDPIMSVAYQLAVSKRAHLEQRNDLETRGIQYTVQKFNLSTRDINHANDLAISIAQKIKVTQPDGLRVQSTLFPPDDGKRCEH